MQPTNRVTEHRLHATLPNGAIVSITHQDIGVVKNTMQRLTDNKAKFEQVDGNNIFVTHPDWSEGQAAMGYITTRVVPQELSAKTLVEHRQPQRQAA